MWADRFLIGRWRCLGLGVFASALAGWAAGATDTPPVLENNEVLVAFDPASGVITRLRDKASGIDLAPAPSLAENFRLVVLRADRSTATIMPETNRLALIPLPAQVERTQGAFVLQPQTRILVDAASRVTGEYLASQIGKATGWKFAIAGDAGRDQGAAAGHIGLTIRKGDAALGPEAYELTVATNSVALQASDPAGLFYAVQSLLQLLPPQVFSPKPVAVADWPIPCVRIADQPRFKWRGLMLDVSRHFFSKPDIERLLDLMALHKLNTFHWHLVDHDGWRIEIRKHPRLTQLGGWRDDIGYGLDPRISTAYGPDGRYGGSYTQAEIREIVAYAAARHITVVPEIEMPGHSAAALRAYPEFNCSATAGAGLAPPLGVYCAGREETFAFLEDVLKEVSELFPGQYIHIGGDEVSKENWKKCPQCQARMKQEGLKDEHELQSYFIRRIEKLINARGRTLVGWSEIRQGGLAQNAVMMDWIGGAVESASEGHDVVMAPGDYCYFDHYQSLDHSTEPVAIGCYLPLRQVYAFEPVPAALPPQYQRHIIGGQANLWTEYIASPTYLNYMAFPRLCALAEAVWSPRNLRSWGDFSRRLPAHCRRLDELAVPYRANTAIEIGDWSPALVATQAVTLAWDVTRVLTQPNPKQIILDDRSRPLSPDLVTEPGKCHVVFGHTAGGTLKIAWVALLEDGREIARDTHPGLAGPEPRDLVARDVVYVLSLSAGKKGARYTVQAHVAAEASNDSRGLVELDPFIRGKTP